MKLGNAMSSSRGGTDPLLAEAARQLTLRGVRLCETVQLNTEWEGSAIATWT